MSEKAKNIIERIVIPSVLTLALIAVAFWGAEQSALAEDYKTNVENTYRRSFTELSDNMNELEVALGKLRVVTTPAMSVFLLDDIWRISGVCVSLMSRIPASHVDTAELNAFIVRLGDYARSLAKKALAGTPASDDDRATLEELYTSCAEISRDLSDRLSVGDIPTEVTTAEGYYEEADDTYKSEEGISKFPTLIYDGPYSEASEQLEPKGVTGEDVTEDTALERARAVTGCSDISLDGESNGTIPAWDFSGTDGIGNEICASVSRTGGHMVWFMGQASTDAEGVPDRETSDKLAAVGLEWLKKQDYENMKATYAQYYGGTALINYAPVMNGAIVYNDLVKVWIDVATYSVVGADARGYLNCHTERTIELPALMLDEARSLVSSDMEIVGEQLALIPLTPGTEVLAWEFRARYGEDEYIIYIDANTGDERQIFVIISTENGQLTM